MCEIITFTTLKKNVFKKFHIYGSGSPIIANSLRLSEIYLRLF